MPSDIEKRLENIEKDISEIKEILKNAFSDSLEQEYEGLAFDNGEVIALQVIDVPTNVALSITEKNPEKVDSFTKFKEVIENESKKYQGQGRKNIRPLRGEE